MFVITTFLHSCVDDEHSDSSPERHRHGCVFLDVADRSSPGGRHSNVTQEHEWPFRLSLLGCPATALVFCNDVNLQHRSHGTGSLRCCPASPLVQRQCKNSLSNVDDRNSVFCRTIICINAAYAVVRCLSVRLSYRWDSNRIRTELERTRTVWQTEPEQNCQTGRTERNSNTMLSKRRARMLPETLEKLMFLM